MGDFGYALTTWLGFVLVLLFGLASSAIFYFNFQKATEARWRKISLCAEILSLIALTIATSAIALISLEERVSDQRKDLELQKRIVMKAQDPIFAFCVAHERISVSTQPALAPNAICSNKSYLASPYREEFDFQLSLPAQERALALAKEFHANPEIGPSLSAYAENLLVYRRVSGNISQLEFVRDIGSTNRNSIWLFLLIFVAIISVSLKIARAWAQVKSV